MQTEHVERRLAAVMAADVVGYSRLMGSNEVGTLIALKIRRREIIDPRITENHGRIVKLTGDGILAEFSSVVGAVDCAAKIQREMFERNVELPEDRRIELRIGINLGDIILDDEDIFGDGVNIASRIESIARPGGIAVSAVVRDNIGHRLDLGFEDMGEQSLKNINRPIRVFDVRIEGGAVSAPLSGAASARPSIAVLPFTNMSGDEDQGFFADGITEDLITDLSKISSLFVVSRHSSFTYKEKSVRLDQAARELGVRFIVEGSVRKAGQRVRVTAQLADGHDGSHLWADRYDRNLTDIFEVQDEITRIIVDQLKVRLLPAEVEAIAYAPTRDVEAYSCCLKGRELFHLGSKASITSAREMFMKAIEIDPVYARAFSGLADCDSRLRSKYGSAVTVDEILGTIDKALSIDPNLAEAHAARGYALMVGGRREEAAASFARGLAIDPACHEAQYHYADYCFTGGDFECAARHYVRALELKPEDFVSPILLLGIFRSLGRPGEAEQYARLGLKRAEAAMKLRPEDSKPAQMAAAALVTLGERDQALIWVERALTIDPDDNSARYNAACVYALAGRADRAIDLLEKYLPSVGPDLKQWFLNDSDLDAVRDHPRYGELLAIARHPRSSVS